MMRLCAGVTKRGRSCRAPAAHGGPLCISHLGSGPPPATASIDIGELDEGLAALALELAPKLTGHLWAGLYAAEREFVVRVARERLLNAESDGSSDGRRMFSLR